MTTNLPGSVPAGGAPTGSLCNVGYGFWLVANKLAMAGTQEGVRAANAAQSLRLDATTGEYWVDVGETCRAYMAGSGQGYVGAPGDLMGGELISASTPYSDMLSLDMTNPFYAEALVIVQHEFAYDFSYSDSDAVACRGDVNISGAGQRVDGGGTTGQFAGWGYDGSAKTPTDETARVFRVGSYEIIYIVPPGATFTINQIAVLAVASVGAGRGLYGLHNGFKARIFARKV